MSSAFVHTPESAAGALLGGAELTEDALHLVLDGGPGGHCRIRVRSNSRQLIAQLRTYFAHVAGPPADPTLEVVAVEREAVDPRSDLGVRFTF